MKQFTFEYDLQLGMNPVVGRLVFSEDGMIRSFDGEQEVLSLPAKGIKEVKVQAGVGCGLLFAEYDGQPSRILCRFSMSGLKMAGEFSKIVNFYNLTGRAEFPETVEKHVCEKCGRAMVQEIKVCVFCYNKFSVMKRALGFLKPYAKTITISQIANSLSLIAFLISPLFTQMLIDRHLAPEEGGPIGPWQAVAWICFGMLMSRVIAEVVTIISARHYNKASVLVFNDMRSATYQKLQSHSMSLFAKRTPGDLIRRIMDDTGTVGEFLTDMGRWVLEMCLMFTIALTILFLANWQLALLILVPVPLVALGMYFFQKVIRARFERQWRKSSRVNTILHDIIKGIRTVKSFGNEKREIEKFSAANKDLAQISSDNEVLWGLMFPPMGFVVGIGEFLILGVGGWMVLNGSLSIGTLVLFTMLLWAIYEPLRWLVNVPRWLANTTTSMVKVFELLDDDSEITHMENPATPVLTGQVKYDRVYFGYKSYEPVLKGIDLEIHPGEMIGLVGKSGVGKSTMINLAMRLYDPNNGAISISNTDLREMEQQHLHENMGAVFQDSFLFAGTFFENIRYGKPDATLEEVIASAKAANAHDFIVQSPDGYNTLVGEGGQTLSGGERQRLSIARAIIKSPDLLILDEATSSLDVETEALIQDSLTRITKGRTTIAIAHRLSTLRNADRLVVLDKDGVAEIGTHSELLKKRGIYYGLVMAQRQSSRKDAVENA
jgi:ATP-binding cassette subfamily B protein